MKPTTIANIKVGACSVALFILFAVPSFSCASQGGLVISEIMYDATGSDSGREWIEVANTGSVAVDMSGYKLLEGGTNHGISLSAGTTTLGVGEVAIITNNPQKFLGDFPHYAGTVFKSSFSLSNAGETMVLKNNLLAQVDSASYTSARGAAGDGNSLHKSADSWIPGAPNPGGLAITAAIKPPPVVATAAKASKSSALSAVKSKIAVLSNANVSQAAAVEGADAPFQIPAFPQGDTLWTTALGLAALMVVGVVGALYVRTSQTTHTTQETTLSADEFEIE